MSVTHGKDWWIRRRGMITSSRAASVLNGTLKGWQSLANTLLDEMASDEPLNDISELEAIKWGCEHEEEAIANFELETLHKVKHPGFVAMNGHIGSTPDFRYLDNRVPTIGEVKCPFNSANHHEVILTRRIPDRYVAQCQWHLWTNNAKRGVFVSYDPRIRSVNYRLVMVPFVRDDRIVEILERNSAYIAELTTQIAKQKGVLWPPKRKPA